jgi:uncharacterized membrane protein YhaH (DUF805 family)
LKIRSGNDCHGCQRVYGTFGKRKEGRKEGLMGGIIALVVLVLDIIAILDVLKSSIDTGKKALWIVLILVLPVIGMVLYFLIGQKK